MTPEELKALWEEMKSLDCGDAEMQRKVYRHAFRGEAASSSLLKHLKECPKCRVSVEFWKEKGRVARLFFDQMT